MSVSLQCASCGAILDFKSGASVFAVCKYCNTAQIKTGVALESLGSMAQLKQDYSVLQIGAQGSVQGKQFGVFGRIRLSWERGVWDEWYLVMEDESTAWLAEAQGFYYFSKQIEIDRNLFEFPLHLGQRYVLEDFEYRVKDCKSATCTYSEGELPFSGALGEKYLSYDLFTKSGSFLSISQVEDEVLVYKGEVYSFEELTLSNLRALDGWSVND